MTLPEILQLVGPLDDRPGQSTGRERFRAYLLGSVRTISALRAAVEACRREPGPHHDRAFQDLVNHCGRILGFTVEFGRYANIRHAITHDGLWLSPAGFGIVVEVETGDGWSRPAALNSHISRLVRLNALPDGDDAFGLYVVQSDTTVAKVKEAIEAEALGYRLRVVSIDGLLSIADTMQTCQLPHEELRSRLRADDAAPTQAPAVGAIQGAAGPSPASGRRLLIVARDWRTFYKTVAREFAGDERTEVVQDRRLRERRHHVAGIRMFERRRADRRQRPNVDEELRRAGYVVVSLG